MNRPRAVQHEAQELAFLETIDRMPVDALDAFILRARAQHEGLATLNEALIGWLMDLGHPLERAREIWLSVVPAEGRA